MRRQKNSGQGGDRAWSRGNRRGVREGRDVNNQEWSWKKEHCFSDQRIQCVLNQFLKGREWLWFDGWAKRVKSLQKENRHQRLYTVFRSKSALPEHFNLPLAYSQGTSSVTTLTDGLGLDRKIDQLKETICQAVPVGLFPENPTGHGTRSTMSCDQMLAFLIKRQEKRGTGGLHNRCKTKSTCMVDVK